MSELSFLMELFLDDELPKNIRGKIKDRIKEVEESLVRKPAMPSYAQQQPIAPLQTDNPIIAKQSPSMQRLMQNNPDLVPQIPQPTTPQAAQALAAREALIASKGKEAGRSGPRKF